MLGAYKPLMKLDHSLIELFAEPEPGPMRVYMSHPVRLLRRPLFEAALGSYRGTDAVHAYSRHFHDEIVLGFNLVGAEWLRLDGRDLVARQGDITLYNPAQVQEGGSLAPEQEWRFLSVYIDSGIAHRLLYGTDGSLEFDGATLACSEAGALFRQAESRFLAGRGAELDELVALLLGRLTARVGTTRGNRRIACSIGAADRRLRRIAERLAEEPAAPADLSGLAREAGLSVEHMVRSFAQAFGLPPMAWAMQRRLVLARRLLRRGNAPAAVAAELGFADQSHLNRFFKRVSGMTPAAFARAAG